MNSRNSSTRKLTFSAIMAALSTVLLFLSGIIPVATIALPAIAGCLLIPVVVESNTRWGFAVYIVCSILSLLLVADKEAALFYVLFFGYYPVLYAPLGKISVKPLRMLIKLIIFNAAIVLETLISIYILSIPFEVIELLGVFTIPVLLVFANAVFLLYDSALNGVIVLYIRRFHNKISNLFRF